ncbi:MAG: tRNA adenosine(34) deaminase TadA [candidate division FCPU426 bacterium]
MKKKSVPAHSPEVRFMHEALKLARQAAEKDEVPVGALIVQGFSLGKKAKVIARAHNLTESKHDPCGHAELLAIRAAAKKLKRWRLSDCTLVVTLEPCAMCAGAAVWSRLDRVVYGARDPKAGACGSVLQVASNSALNHRVSLASGVLEDACGELLRAFFRQKRKKA